MSESEQKAMQAAQTAQQARSGTQQAKQAAEAAEMAAAAAKSSGLQVLAPGWTEVQGPNGPYYCNPSTGETSWTKPIINAPSASEAEGSVKETASTKAAADERSAAAVQSAEQVWNTYEVVLD